MIRVSKCVSHRLSRSMSQFQHLNFDNLALRRLPLDESRNNECRQVPGACFSLVSPTPVESPVLVAASKSALSLVGLDDTDEQSLADYFSGNKLLSGSKTAAHCYAGHQFGSFSGQLGDGTALHLGEIVNTNNERWELQLKGIGQTPYSRQSDGRKVLRSSIREFLASEAMHFLGIPTTRAGTCVSSNSTVIRDIFYNGNAKHERCAIVLRIAPTFLRFGSFEIFKSKDDYTGRVGPSADAKHHHILNCMLEYTMETFYPEIWKEHHEDFEKCVIEFYRSLIDKTAHLVALWQSVGFCHGVLNTDNMSICGVTIDYGPFGFMDYYDPVHICNLSDGGGRYAFNKQPSICKWNLAKLMEMLQIVVKSSELQSCHDRFDEIFEKYYISKMRKKLGLRVSLESDGNLIQDLLQVMRKSGSDFTNTFRALNKITPSPNSDNYDQCIEEFVDYILTQCATADEVKNQYRPSLPRQELEALQQIATNNPELLVFMGGNRIMKELKKLEMFSQYQDLTQEVKTSNDITLWRDWLKKYSQRLASENLSNAENIQDRILLMNSNNPRFILRNYLLQLAIEKAERGDFEWVRLLLRLSEDPYSEEDGPTVSFQSKELSNFCGHSFKKPPSWSRDIKVS